MEYNTIAASFLCLSDKVADIHKYVIDKYGDQLSLNYTLRAKEDLHSFVRQDEDLGGLPIHAPNASQMGEWLDGIAETIRLYKESTGTDAASKPIVLFIVDDHDRNLCDQKLIEVNLYKRHGIHSLRKSLAEVAAQADFDRETKRLCIAGREVGLVYFRSGYQED